MTLEGLAPRKYNLLIVLLAIDTPAFDPATLPQYHELLKFLHDQLSPYFSSIQDANIPQQFFLTLIVGSPDHLNAKHCLLKGASEEGTSEPAPPEDSVPFDVSNYDEALAAYTDARRRFSELKLTRGYLPIVQSHPSELYL